jgi:CRP/FNR family cyclic AMP-dependent transcriptional regulator
VDTRRESVQILDADPGLGEGLSPAQLSVAARLVVAPVLRLGTGVWEFEAERVPDAGFLVVQGCITREVVILGETAAIEFLRG